MKDIKFRGWDEITGMFNIDVLAISPCTWDCPDYKTRGVSLAYQSHIKVMRYTGLKDKNNKEIYEGDIVNCLELRNDTLNRYISEVFFEDGSWLVHENEMCDTYLYLYDNTNPTKMPLTEIEVIGNIHENKDLID